jgi:myo-inositol-1-phosphate synthase
LVIGGHEIRSMTPLAAARELQQASQFVSDEVVKACRPLLESVRKNVKTGTALHCGAAVENLADRALLESRQELPAIVKQLRRDIDGFKKSNRLDHVVVVNVASTEPAYRPRAAHTQWSKLEPALERNGQSVLPASSLYAIAAVAGGHTYLNFTPSLGVDVPAIRELAAQTGALYMGCDGKTGETLMKSALAPMFAARNLKVLSWVGHNIFGNRDGLVLDDPLNKAAKVRSKDHLISSIVGYKPQTLVSIEYIESLQDWKTAWDFIHFAGFLNTKMSLQFVWSGADSVLAAPLVLDMVRLADHARCAGETGPMPQLACFFKSPMDVDEQNFFRQFDALRGYLADAIRTRHAKKPRTRKRVTR